jgi:hypothetical protein
MLSSEGDALEGESTMILQNVRNRSLSATAPCPRGLDALGITAVMSEIWTSFLPNTIPHYCEYLIPTNCTFNNYGDITISCCLISYVFRLFTANLGTRSNCIKNYCIQDYQYQVVLMDEQNTGENYSLWEVMYDLSFKHAQAHYLVCIADLV